MAELSPVARDTLYLMNCALHGIAPGWSGERDWEGLLRFCKFHTLTAMAAMALERDWAQSPPAPEVRKPWDQEKNQSIRRGILMNAEREAITAQLERMGCRYLPLKGSLLQFDYPQFGMRQMSDNDILIDPAFREQVHDWMLTRGYEAVTYMTQVEDSYQKKPLFHFEMHSALFGLDSDPAFRRLYETVWDRLLPVEGKQFGLRFTHEDFYVYLVAHGWKHALWGGMGLKILGDLWVFEGKHPDLDFAYIEGELEKLGARDYGRLCRRVCHALFDVPGALGDLTGEEQALLHSLSIAGAYGTAQIRMQNRLGDAQAPGAKLRYLLRRIFPSAETLAITHPEVLQRRWLVPFYWVRRLIRALFQAPGTTLKELKLLRSQGKEP